MKKLFTLLLLFIAVCTQAQVKIGNNPGTIDANSLLELESTNKGFLPPRVALNSNSSVSPLTGTVPAGMLVYSTGGTLTDGYYYWDGAKWKMIGTTRQNMVSKTANATLLQTETFVLASNDITLTLPVVTSADDGLELTIKHIGSHTDLITVVGSASATIDGIAESYLTRWMGQTFVATGGNWVIKEPHKFFDHRYELDENASWQTLQEVIDFLNLHMFAPSVIILADETYNISSTITINLPYALTIEGLSYSTTTIAAASGLAGKPMFRCSSETYFKMLTFEATTLSGYGTSAGEDAIRYIGSDTYNEIKDCSFNRFYNTILDSTNAELWVFETDIDSAQNNGLLIHGADAGVIIKVAETDFIGCKRGVNMDKGSGATIQLASGGYYNANSTDTAIICRPSTFTSYSNISIKGNLWNNTGKYIEGFDFTRTDARDANVVLEGNSGMGDKKPYCFINVINSGTSKTLTAQNTWYKADWGSNTIADTCKWTISSNKITYQPVNRKNGIFFVAGNLSVNSSSQNINIAIVKNGVSTTRYGETTLRVTTSGQPFQFSFIAFIADIAPGDYFEIYYSDATEAGKAVTIQDIQWLTTTQ